MARVRRVTVPHSGVHGHGARWVANEYVCVLGPPISVAPVVMITSGFKCGVENEQMQLESLISGRENVV